MLSCKEMTYTIAKVLDQVINGNISTLDLGIEPARLRVSVGESIIPSSFQSYHLVNVFCCTAIHCDSRPAMIAEGM